MALIKHAQAATLAREAIVLDLGDLHRQGSALVQQARDQAARLVEEAKRERERILAGAAEEGRKAGFEKGMAEGRIKGVEEGKAAALKEHKATLEKLEASWAGALGAFVAARDEMLVNAGRDVLRLAALVSEKVAKRAVVLDAKAVEPQLEAVLALVVRPTSLAVRINPGDREVAESALPKLLRRFGAVAHAELIDDPSLTRGSCVAACRDAASDAPGSRPGGEIDASIETQIARIIETLLPGEGGDASASRAAEREP